MSAENPYTTPEAAVELAGMADYQPKIFSASGRIGRLRYLAYVTGMNLLLYAIFIPLMGGTAFMTEGPAEMMASISGLVMILFYILTIVLSIIFAKRRLNDLDKTGWFLLLFLVPIVNLILAIYMIFFRGSEGENRFGAAPVANTLGVKILGLLLPIIMIVGIVAYQGFIQ